MFDKEGALIHQMKESKRGTLTKRETLSLKWSTLVVIYGFGSELLCLINKEPCYTKGKSFDWPDERI